MPDGSGAPGAVAEFSGKAVKKTVGGVKSTVGSMVSEAADELTGYPLKQQSPQQIAQQQAAQQKIQQKGQQALIDEQKTPGKIQDVQQQLKALQSNHGQNAPKQTPIQSGQTIDGNGQNPVLARRLFQDVQGDLALTPEQLEQRDREKQKQIDAQKKQEEEQEELRKKEEAAKKMSAPVMPSSGKAKGPGAPQKQQQGNQLEAVKQSVNKDYGKQAKG